MVAVKLAGSRLLRANKALNLISRRQHFCHEDVGKDPLPQVKKSIQMAKSFKNVEILWASTREPYNYIQAKQLGCHIITVPPSIIEKIEKFGKSFQKLTTDTVKGFLIDTKKSKFKI
mgnify:CR=1 FL=1